MTTFQTWISHENTNRIIQRKSEYSVYVYGALDVRLFPNVDLKNIEILVSHGLKGSTRVNFRDRERICMLLHMIDKDVKDENKIKTSRENKRVNIINQDVEQIACAYFKRVGHGAVNCITLAKYYWQQRANQNNFNGQSGFN